MKAITDSAFKAYPYYERMKDEKDYEQIHIPDQENMAICLQCTKVCKRGWCDKVKDLSGKSKKKN